MIITIISFIVVLSILVFVHELGHFWTARKLGVKAEEFGIGFPPRLGGFYKDKEGEWKFVRGKKEVKDASDTIYSINWIPLGGFVQIKGQDGDLKDDKDSFASKAVWKRMLIISAGVIMNLILAAFLFSIGYMFGLPTGTDGLDPSIHVSNEQVQIVNVVDGTPAKEAGLEMADIVLKIDNIDITKEKQVQDYNFPKGGQELTYTIQRGSEIKELKITPIDDDNDGNATVGIQLANIGLVKYPWYLAIWHGFKTMFLMTYAIIMAFGGLFAKLFTGQGVPGGVGGPIMIAKVTGQFAQLGFLHLTRFTAMLSINLAVLNFLPIPALDGGRFVFLIIEKIKGKPVKQELEAIIHNTAFLLLMLLVLLVTIKDIAGIQAVKNLFN